MTAQIDWNVLARHAHTITASLAMDARTRAYRALWTELEPAIERWVRSPGFLGRVSDDEDHQREILVRSWERLRERDYARLRTFVQRTPAEGAQLRAYLYRVVKNLGIDYLRTLPEFIRRPQAAEADHATEFGAGHWHSVVAWTPALELGVETDTDLRMLAHRMLAYLDEPGRREQRRALLLWAQGHDMLEIAVAMKLDAAATADRLVAAAKEALRRRSRG
jgi:DNA-directed RNA polymerase specialized sigma24 family protein